MINLLDQNISVVGKIAAGTYTLNLDSVQVLENVVNVYSKSNPVPKALLKATFNKEKVNLPEDIIRQIDSLDLGAEGVFPDGQPKPRWQNRTNFNFHEIISGNKFTVSIWGGPKINKGIGSFIKQATGIDPADHTGKPLNEIMKIGDQFTAVITVEGDFNAIDQSTVRKVGLEPLPTKEGNGTGANTSDEPFTQVEQALVDYLMANPGLPKGDIGLLATKGIVQNGIALNDFGTITNAWSGIKAKVAQAVDADGKINIILK